MGGERWGGDHGMWVEGGGEGIEVGGWREVGRGSRLVGGRSGEGREGGGLTRTMQT